jgi:hypothetical protein
VDQRFEDDVMQYLSGEGPAVSSDEAAFAAMAAAATDGFGEEPLEDDMREDTDPAANVAAEDGPARTRTTIWASIRNSTPSRRRMVWRRR